MGTPHHYYRAVCLLLGPFLLQELPLPRCREDDRGAQEKVPATTMPSIWAPEASSTPTNEEMDKRQYRRFVRSLPEVSSLMPLRQYKHDRASTKLPRLLGMPMKVSARCVPVSPGFRPCNTRYRSNRVPDQNDRNQNDGHSGNPNR